MARPCKKRFVSAHLKPGSFRPRGVAADRHAVLRLSLDELEALRLADLCGDAQDQAAAKMNISRQTFGRILERARSTVADALLNGKAIDIAGGPVTPSRRDTIRCRRCRRSWEVPVPVAATFRCPRCPGGAQV
jgi:predicted DNA-binding protein (UPF0251 family)